MTKTFFNSAYKEKKKKIMLDVEKSYLPATQTLVEVDIRVENINKIIAKKRQAIDKLKSEIDQHQEEIYNIRHFVVDTKTEKTRYIHKCPAEQCNGFLSGNHSCGICETKVCKDCREIVSEEDSDSHECNEDILKTIQALKKETKPCPKCSTTIYKIDGCDQMFCTMCHTAFSWKTLRIESGVIHNPHYYQWLRNTNGGEAPRNANDIPHNNAGCGVNMRYLHISIKNKMDNMNKEEEKIFWDIYRLRTHVEMVVIPTFNAHETLNHFDNNVDLRKQFLTNKITEDKLKSELFKRDKRNSKKNEIKQILELFVQTIREFIVNMHDNNDKLTLRNLQDFIKEASSIRSFVNDALVNVSDRFNCVKHAILTTWEMQ